jgi:hypothetical protein
MLPPTDDSAWEDLVAGTFAETSYSSSSDRKHRRLGLTSASDMDLLKPLCGRHSLLFKLLKAGTRLMQPWIWFVQKLTARLPLPLFQPAYTIDAESKILGPIVDGVAYLLDTEPGLLLKDRYKNSKQPCVTVKASEHPPTRRACQASRAQALLECDCQ